MFLKINKINEWLTIDAILQQKLKELEELNKERELIIAKAEKQLTSEMQKELEISLLKYTELAKQVAVLKKQAKELKEINDI